MKSKVAGRSRDRRRRWSLALAYAVLLASCDSPFAPERQDVERLDVNPAVLTLVVGGNATLVAKVYGPNDLLMPGAKVFWSTQDPTVVTVSQDGLVNGVAAGTAQIAASSGGQSRTIAVTVAQKPIALVRIAPPAATVITGQTFQLQGEALDGEGNVLPNRLLEWSSTQPTVATVNSAGMVTGVAVGQATISAIGEGRVGTSLITVTPAPVASITIQPNGGSVPAGSTLTFTATARDAGGQVLTGRPITWRSSNDAVATVSAGGLMTALSPGVATITASAPNAGPGGTTPTASVTVTVLIEPVASAVIVPSPAVVQVGQVLNLSVNLFNSGGDPLSAAGRTIAWSSSNTAIATVDAAGKATGVSNGVVTITATITTPGQAGTVQASVQLTVSNQPVGSVVITPSSAIVHVGYAKQFSAVVLDGAGQPLQGRQVVWTSSNQSVATVDATTGLVSGVGQGNVGIRATADGVQGVANVTIDLVRIGSVFVSPQVVTMMPGQTTTLVATPRDSAGNPIQNPALGGRGTSWVSSNSAIASVNFAGVVTGVVQGSATVTATIGGASGQSSVTVSPLPSASQLVITTQPSASVPNDAPFPVQPVVQLKDVNGNNVATAGVVITAAITPPGVGALGGAVAATTDATGAAAFSSLKITGTTGIRTLTFTSGAVAPATSSGVDVTAGAASQLILVTPPPTSANSGQAFSSASVLQLRDVSGNNVPQAGVLVTASSSPGATLSGGSTTTTASGTATFGALTLTGPAGNYTVTFNSGALPPATSGPIALSAGGGSKLSISAPPPASVPNGQAFGVTVQLLDGSNNPVAQPGVTVTAAINSGGPTLGGTTNVLTNASGVATFTDLTITGAIGARTLLFGAGGFTAVTSGVINVTPGPATALFLASPPSSSVPSGATFGAQPAVQLRDASGNAVAQASVAVTVAPSAGATLVGSNTATTDGAGLATFSGLGLSGTAGPGYSLSFSSGSLTPTSSGPISITFGAAAQLAITTQPGGGANGSALSPQPVLQVRDAQGNPVLIAGTNVTATVAGGPGATVIAGGSATTNGSGQAAFSGLSLAGTVGSYTIGFSDGAHSATSATVNLTHGPAAQLVIQTQPGGAASGAAFTTQPVVLVRDAQLNPVPGVTVSATPSAGATLVGSGGATSDAAGLATFSGLGLSGLIGNYTIAFSASGVPNVTSGSIALGAGAAARLAVSAPPPASVANGAAFSASVQIQDGAGNPLSTNGVAVNVALVGSGATLGGTTPVNTAAGVAAFTGLTITGLVGNYSLSFTSTGLAPAPSGTIALTPGAAAKLAMSSQPPGTVLSGTSFSAAVQLQDASGNAVPQSGTPISASVIGPGALSGTTNASTIGAGVANFSGLVITGAGSHTLSFSGVGLTSITSSSVTVTLPATQLGMVSQPPVNAASGSTFGASVQLLDVNGNPVNQGGVTVNVAITGGGGTLLGTPSATTNGSGVATFSGIGIAGLVGNYSLTFSSGSLTSVQSSGINLTFGAPAQLVFVTAPPGAATTAVPLASHSVQVRDAQGNDVTTAGISVSASIAPNTASITAGASANTDASGLAAFSGLTISGTGGPYTLTYSAGGGVTVQSAITLGPFFDVESSLDDADAGVTEVTLMRDDASWMGVRGEGEARVSISRGTPPVPPPGNLRGTPNLRPDTQETASATHLTIDRVRRESLRFGAIAVGTTLSNPFVVNP